MDGAGKGQDRTDETGGGTDPGDTARTTTPWRHAKPRRRTWRLRITLLPLTRPALRWRLPAPPPRRVAAIALTLALGGWLGGTTLHDVGTGQAALVLRLGALSRTLGPGLGVTLPWPVESVRIVDVARLRHLAMPDDGGTIDPVLTRDGALVDLAFDVRWRIADARRHALGLADPGRALHDEADAAMRQAAAGFDAADILGPGRAALAQFAAQRLQHRLDAAGAGIAIAGIDIARAEPPARIAEGWRAVQAARQDGEAERAQARLWAAQVIANAQAEAQGFDRIEAEYAKAPHVTRERLYFETMEQVMRQSDKVIVDAPGTTVQGALPQAARDPQGAGNGH